MSKKVKDDSEWLDNDATAAPGEDWKHTAAELNDCD